MFESEIYIHRIEADKSLAEVAAQFELTNNSGVRLTRADRAHFALAR